MKSMGRVVFLIAILAGCTFSSESNKPPTVQPTQPVALVNTPLPTLTHTPDATITPTKSSTPSPTVTPTAPPVTNTPTTAPTLTPTPPTSVPPTSIPMAQVCETCGQLRLRQSPGTAGQIITHLAALTPLNVIGRTTDSAWLQVTLSDGSTGWVDSQYLVVNVDLNAVEITGVAENTAVAASSSNSSNNRTYISGISFHARQIFLDGQSRGNRAGSFSKVGDSITYSWAFLYPLADDYSLGEYSYLSPALSFFSGPNGRGENCFDASPIAAYPGWTTADVLRPGGAKTGSCGPSETPLECEYRTAQPSVALIMFGTNDVAQGVPLDRFGANLQRIVDISISQGVIPVLSTIPPFPTLDGNARAFNQVIIATARANDIPLWDYYSSVNGLPNRGLSRDGVHPSESPDNQDATFDEEHLQYGFNVRNLGALQALYELWRQVLYEGGTPLPAEPVDPASYTCAGAPPIRLYVGGSGRVTPGVPNKLRNTPSLSSAEIGSIPGEGVFTVTGGPHCADGYTWWQVNYNGVVGWTASGNSSEYWVEPLP